MLIVNSHMFLKDVAVRYDVTNFHIMLKVGKVVTGKKFSLLLMK